MLSVGASMEEYSHAFVIIEFSLFPKLSIPQFMCVHPLA